MPDARHRQSIRVLMALMIAGIGISAWPDAAEAQIRRCTAPDGVTIYTDRSCADVGGVPRAPDVPAVGSTLGPKPYMRGCSRTLRDLIFDVTAAIDSHDANRLAGVYHWAGMSGRGSVGVLSRLDAIVERPLVQVMPILPAPRVTLDTDAGLTVAGNLDAARVAADIAPADGVATDDVATEGSAAVSTSDQRAPSAPTRVRRRPIGLRVEQTLANGITPSRTTFGLRRNMGCWFVNL